MDDRRAQKRATEIRNLVASPVPDLQRRALLRSGFLGLGLFASGNWLLGCGSSDEQASSFSVPQSQIPFLGPLATTPDANGVRLPAGFSARVVARSGEKPVEAKDFLWHAAPDGGAVFPTDDLGWIYVSNSERSFGFGGVGALRFSASGELVDAYSILRGSNRNCAGGPTTWGTWLSCEEDFSGGRGRVFECDPLGVEAAIAHPAMGLFVHEAAAVDPTTHQIYQTEDRSDGGFYRFTPADPQLGGRPDLGAGTLEIAVVADLAAVLAGHSSTVSWESVPIANPTRSQPSTRRQVAASSPFNGGEGIWYGQGSVYFSTKNDHRIWAYATDSATLSILYDRDRFGEGAILSEPDNVTVSAGGEVLVAEDHGDMQIVAITSEGALVPIVQVVGHDASEMTGPAFDPSGTRLYFSSQRGPGASGVGITYEISGPFVA